MTDSFPLKETKDKHFRSLNGTDDIIFMKRIKDRFGERELEVKINRNQLGYRYEAHNGVSVISLPNGDLIYVALPLDELDLHLTGQFGTHDNAIDLRAATSEFTLNQMFAKAHSLSNVFNLTAINQKIAQDEKLIFTYGTTRMKDRTNQHAMIFSSEDYKNLVVGANSKKVLFSIKDKASLACVWKLKISDGIYPNITKEVLDNALKNHKGSIIDLRELTKPEGADIVQDFAKTDKISPRLKWIKDHRL